MNRYYHFNLSKEEINVRNNIIHILLKNGWTQAKTSRRFNMSSQHIKSINLRYERKIKSLEIKLEQQMNNDIYLHKNILLKLDLTNIVGSIDK